jgi:hypothetical protein
MIELKSWTISRTSQGTNIHNRPLKRLNVKEALEALKSELSDSRSKVVAKYKRSIMTKQRYYFFGLIPCEDIKVFRGVETEIEHLLNLTKELTPVA